MVIGLLRLTALRCVLGYTLTVHTEVVITEYSIWSDAGSEWSPQGTEVPLGLKVTQQVTCTGLFSLVYLYASQIIFKCISHFLLKYGL